APGGPAIEFVEGFEAGSRRASAGELPMLVVFRAGWCRWSAELAVAAAADPSIVALSRRFVCVTVDADRDVATCREFGVEAFPTVLLVEADGSERHRAVGAAAADSLATAMEGVLEQGESLSQFVENAVRTTVARRKTQAEFVRRGIAAIEATQRAGSGIPADVVIARLEAKLAAARQAKAQRGG
ncbi:MAG: hypothetical protein EBR23_15435, partial [Planctomycetia bacterium]|nr:hypothetical protein [Planctomycetia bacterium]